MDITLIVPCHNLEKYIKNLLLSLHMLNLDNIEYEIIFVLDDCTDNTQSIVEEYMKDMNYSIIPCNVHSPGYARNIGLDAATHTYIWFLDGDDWIIYPDVLQKVLPLLQETGDEMVQLSFISNLFNMQHFSMVWQYIFKYDLIKNIRFSDKQNHEDDEFMKTVLASYSKVDQLLVLNIPCYFYNYCRPGSQTTLERENLKVKI